jgi:predicted RND superfamily exporter protein
MLDSIHGRLISSRSNILLLTNISSSGDILAAAGPDRGPTYAGANFPGEITWDVTGFGIVISASSRQLTTGQIKSLSLTMAMVFGIMFMLFLSWKVALIAIVPNLFPIVVNFGIMGWLGIELSMATSLIASVAIGLAVDDTIHYLVRFNREFKTDLDPSGPCAPP